MKNYSLVLIMCLGGGLATATAHAQAAPQPTDPTVPRDPTRDPIPEPTDPPSPADPSNPGAPSDPVGPTTTDAPVLDAEPPVVVATPVVVEVQPADVDVIVPAPVEVADQRVGVMLLVGGGVVDFTDGAMRDRTKVGGLWDVRAVLGSRAAFGVEAGYRGSAQAIDALGLDSNAMLLGTTFEGVVRVNLSPRAQLNPYLFGGAAWTRYSLSGADTNTSDVAADDDMLEVPVGLGMGYRVAGFVADLRGEVRMVNGDDLVVDNSNDGTLELHTWSASARLGYEF